MSKYQNIKAKSLYTKTEIDTIGVQLLEWMDLNPKENWYLKDFLNDKIIPFGHLERFRKLSASFNEAWELALQKMETHLVKELVRRKGIPTGILAILKNEVGWKEDPKNQVEVNVQREELEEILKKKFPKRDLFVTKEGKLSEKVSESKHQPLLQD